MTNTPTAGRDELDVMRELRVALNGLPDQTAKLRVLRWLQGVVSDVRPPDTRGLSDKWQSVMQDVADRPNFTIDDLATSDAAREFSITRAQLRAQVHNYAKREWIAKTAQAGLYEWTPDGRQNLLNGASQP